MKSISLIYKGKIVLDRPRGEDPHIASRFERGNVHFKFRDYGRYRDEGGMGTLRGCSYSG